MRKNLILFTIFTTAVTISVLFITQNVFAIECTCLCIKPAQGGSPGSGDIDYPGELKTEADYGSLAVECQSVCQNMGYRNFVVGARCDGIEYMAQYCDKCHCECKEVNGRCTNRQIDFPNASEPSVLPKSEDQCRSACYAYCLGQGSGEPIHPESPDPLCAREASSCNLVGGVNIPGEETPTTPETPGTPVPEKIQLNPPFGQAGQDAVKFIQESIGTIIKWALGIVGSIALLMFVIGGFTWLTAAGNPDRIKQGKNILTWAAIGLAAIFAAYTITNFILTALLG